MEKVITNINDHCINCKYWAKKGLCLCDLHQMVTLGSESCSWFKMDDKRKPTITVSYLLHRR